MINNDEILYNIIIKNYKILKLRTKINNIKNILKPYQIKNTNGKIKVLVRTSYKLLKNSLI